MRNRRIEQEPPQQRALATPTLRLRYVLLAALVAGGAFLGYPRAKAAWTLHDQATALANYGLCMAGPTGPTVVVQQPEEFERLLRRRLISQEPDAQPFADCRSVYEEYNGSGSGAALEGRAEDFVEYGSPHTPTVALTLSSLIVDSASLGQLQEHSWPFSRGDYESLLRPSSHAREAAHPVEFPVPVYGSGLPSWEGLYRTAWGQSNIFHLAVGYGANLSVFRSVNGGQDWSKSSLAANGVGDHGGRCGTDQAPQSFVFEQSEETVSVVSFLGDDPVSRTTLRVKATPRSSSCDDATAVFVAEPEDEREAPYVVLCQHSGRCGRLRVPAEWTSEHFDIAQISGVTVVASVAGGVVRVRSSRDRGKTWTPATVALDATSVGIPLSEARDVRLLAVGGRVLLWLPGAAERSSYPLVVSEDFGASFRGADPAAEPVRPSRSVARR